MCFFSPPLRCTCGCFAVTFGEWWLASVRFVEFTSISGHKAPARHHGAYRRIHQKIALGPASLRSALRDNDWDGLRFYRFQYLVFSDIASKFVFPNTDCGSSANSFEKSYDCITNACSVIHNHIKFVLTGNLFQHISKGHNLFRSFNKWLFHWSQVSIAPGSCSRVMFHYETILIIWITFDRKFIGINVQFNSHHIT